MGCTVLTGCLHLLIACLEVVLAWNFPKRGPKSLLEMIEREISGGNDMLIKYFFLHGNSS